MATSPQRRHVERKPPLVEKPPERRKASSERGYGWAWTKYADNLRRDRVFCECCLELGIETPCAGQTTTDSGRKKSQGVVDHIVPVENSADPLFWEEANHWILCVACNAAKSLEWDGTYGKRKIVAESRDLDGIARRRREIIEARRNAAEQCQSSFIQTTEAG